MNNKVKRVTVRFTLAQYQRYQGLMSYAGLFSWTGLIHSALIDFQRTNSGPTGDLLEGSLAKAAPTRKRRTNDLLSDNFMPTKATAKRSKAKATGPRKR